MTQVGSAHVTISANTSQALQQVTRLMAQAKQQLQRLDKLAVTFDERKSLDAAKALTGKLNSTLKGAAITITPKLDTSRLAGELRNAMRGATANAGYAVTVALKVKPITQGQIDTALKSTTARKEVTIDIKGDAQQKLASLKQGLQDLKNTAATAVTVNTGTVSALIGQLNKQIADLRQIEASLAGTLRNLGRNQGGGQGGGSPGSGTPRPGAVALNTQQLVAQLEAVNNAYKRGDISADLYSRRLTQLKTQLEIAARSATAGTANFSALDRALTNTAQGMQRIQADKITKLRTELATARQAFDNAAAAATSFAQRRAAIQQYETALAGVRTKLVALGQSGQLTASQLGTVQRTLGTIAREGNTIRGGVNIAGLSGNVMNALKGLPALAGSLGGPLGAAAAGATSLAGSLGGIAALGGPVGVAIGAVVLALGGLVTGLKASIDTAAQYEQTLADIKALTQPTAAELEKLKAATFDIGKPLGVGATEAAGAVLELNKAGLSTADVIGGGLKGALDLAGASGLKAAEAGVLATSAMTAFGKTGKDLPGIADVFANFANKTFLGAQDLSQAIAAVGPVARSSGIDMQQFAGVMATLAQGGFKNMSDAGTSLKTMLLSLQAPTEKGAGYLKAIGVNVYDSTGKLKPFNQTIGDLRQKLIQLTPEAQKQVMKEIFGTDAVRAAEILLRVGPKAIDANTASMKKQGEAARVAKERLESLQGQTKILGATMEEVRNRIGTPFLGALTGLVKGANGAIQALLNASKGAGQTGLAFQQMNQQANQSLNGLKAIVTAVFGNIQQLWNNVLKPVLTALAAIWSVIQSAVTTALTIVFNTVAGVVNGVKGFIGGLVGAFTGGGNNIKVSLGDVAAKIQNWAAVAREYITAVGKVAGALPKAFGEAGYSIGRIFAGLGKIFAGFALMAYDSLVKPVLPVLAVVRDAFVNVARGIGTAIQNMLQWVADRFRPLIDLMKTIGIGIADQLGRVMQGIADGVKGVVGGAADALEGRAQDEAARAAEEGAKKASGGATLVKEGINDIKNGVSDLKTTIVDFGKVTGQVFENVPRNLEASRKAAADLQRQLSQPTPTPAGSAAGVSGAMASGKTTLAQIDAKASNKPPARTAADLDALDQHKKRLEALKPAELEAERRLQIQQNNRVKLAAVIAEQNRRLSQQEAAVKRQTATDAQATKQREALVKQIRRGIEDFKGLADAGKLNSESLKQWERRMQDLADKAGLLPPALRGGIQELFNQYAALRDSTDGQVRHNDALKKGAAQAKLTGIALDDYKKALRGKSEQQLADLLVSTRAAKNDAAYAAVQGEITRRKEAAAKAADKAAAAARKEAQETARQQKSAGTLARQLDDLNESFQNQVNAGTVTVNKLTEYRQSVDGIKERLKTLPPDLQRSAEAGLAMADALQVSGQEVIGYNAEITKLKESVKGWSYEELQAARDRVEHTSGDKKKLDILDAEIKTRKTATQTILDQAAAESRLSQASAAVSSLEGDFGAAQAKAGDNLQAQYQAVIAFGDRLQQARDAQARAEGAAEAVRIQKKYDDLLKLEGLTGQQIIDLNNALTTELKANSDAVLAKVQENATKKVEAEQQAKARLDEWLLSLDRKTRDTIQAENLKALQKQSSDAEARLAQELQDAEDAGELTASKRYQIYLKNQPLMLAAKKRELEETQRLELQAEQERFDTAIKEAERLGTADLTILGTNQTVRQRLAQEHGKLVEGINNRTTDAIRDYELKVKRDTGKQLQAADKEIAKNRLDAVSTEIDKNLDGLDNFTQAQRNAAQQTLEAWVAVYKAMPGSELSQPAIDALNKAIDKIKAASTKASQDLSKLVVKPEDQKGLSDRSAQDILAVGKPDERDAAIADARAKFNGLIDGYKTKVDELKAALKQFEGIPAGKLTPEQAALQAGLQSSLALYQGFLKNAEGAADEAGKKAGQAFADGQSDKAADAALALAEAQYDLAQAEGRDGSAAYMAGLNAAKAYWKARVEGLNQNSPEYLAALQKVTDLEKKITTAGAAGLGLIEHALTSFSQGQNEGIKSFNTALQGASKGLGSIASPAAIFAAILERINPAGMILEGMFSVLEEPIKALQEPFKTIGTLIGSVIAPVLELIAPILELVAELFVVLYDAIALFIKTITFGIVNIDRRTPKNDSDKSGDNKDPKDPSSLIKLKNQNDLDQLDKDYQKGLISREEYEKGKLKLVKERIDQERQAELDAIDEAGKTAEELAAERFEINRKYDLQYQTEAAAISKEMAQAASEDAQAMADAELAELENMLTKGLISRKDYEKRKLQITIDGLNRQRAREIADAEGNATRIAAINRKYDAQIEKEKMDSLARIKEAYISIGQSLEGALTGGIKNSLTDAVKARNFGVFRSQFAKNLKEAMFDAVLSAAIEAAAFKAILQPAINALTDALESGDKASIDKAIQGMLTAGNKVQQKAREIYKALTPLANAWGINSEQTQTQQIEVVGNVSSPVMKVSLDMLAYLADSIKQVLPGLVTALQAHTPALTKHTEQLTPHTLALQASTQALPTFVESVGSFRDAVQINRDTSNTFSTTVDRMNQIVTAWGQDAGNHASAMRLHAQALGQAGSTGNNSNVTNGGTSSSGGFTRKGG